MPPDRQSQAIIDSLPPFDTARVTPRQLRASERVPPLGPERAQVASVIDRIVPGPAGPIPIRIYTPHEDAPGVLLYFHGGGHCVGSLDGYDGLCCQLARHTGFILVAVDYRLAPEHKFPAATEDCYAAAVWAASYPRIEGGAPRCLVVAGDSAGGNLAAVVCLMARDRGGPAIGAQVLIYPATDAGGGTPSRLRNGCGYFLTTAVADWFLGHYERGPEDRTNPYLSPLRAENHAELPPALVITAEYDPLLDEGEAYAHKLRAAGVATDYRCFPGTIHGFMSFYQTIDQGREAISLVASYLRRN